MKLSLLATFIGFLVLSEAASVKQQLKRARGVDDVPASSHNKNELEGRTRVPPNGRRRSGDGRRAVPLHVREPVDGGDAFPARASTSLLGVRTIRARAVAAAPSVTTTTVTEAPISADKKTKVKPTSTQSSEVDTTITSETTTSSTSASTTTQSAKIVYNKINMTLASMPYEQIMCENSTEVQSGSVINVTWLSKGKYTNTVYIRYGIDDYQAWNLPVAGTLPPFAGVKVQGDENIKDPKSIYRMTFQTQVFAYQKGIKLSIVVLDNQKGLPVVTYESPQIYIKDRCVVKEKEPMSRVDPGSVVEVENEEDLESNEGEEEESEVNFESGADGKDAKVLAAKAPTAMLHSGAGVQNPKNITLPSAIASVNGSQNNYKVSLSIQCFVPFLFVFSLLFVNAI